MTIQFILQILKYMTLWPLFIDRIDLSQGYVPLLSCRLLAGPKQPPPAPLVFFRKKANLFCCETLLLFFYSIWMNIGKNVTPVCIHFAVFCNPLHLLRTPHLLRTKEYFHCYLNQMPKPLSHSFYILRTEKD